MKRGNIEQFSVHKAFVSEIYAEKFNNWRAMSNLLNQRIGNVYIFSTYSCDT